MYFEYYQKGARGAEGCGARRCKLSGHSWHSSPGQQSVNADLQGEVAEGSEGRGFLGKALEKTVWNLEL